MYEQPCQVPERIKLPLGFPAAAESRFMLMPAWNEEHFGLKVIASLPGNQGSAQPALTANYFLFRIGDGHCVATFDGDEITMRRTAATSALAAQRLARPDARRLFILGGGRIAHAVPLCFQYVAPIDQIRVWSRRPEQAALLAEQWRADGISATVEADRHHGAAWADIISTATAATEPIVEGKDVRPGTHVDLIGSFTPAMREADAALMARSSIFVDTLSACKESGDMLQMPISVRESAVELKALLDGKHLGRTFNEEVTVFKSVGHARQDFVVAEWLYKHRVRG